MNEEITKKCSNCSIEKPLQSFHKNKNNKFGVHHLCKKCRKPISKSYRQRPKVKEKRRLYNKKYYRDHREKQILYIKNYSKENADCIKQRHKEYNQRPDVKERINKRLRERYKIPEVRERIQKNVKKHRDREKKTRTERINKIVDDFIEDVIRK